MMRTIIITFGLIAVLGALAAIALWYVLVRPVPRRTGTGVLIDKMFVPAHIRQQGAADARRDRYLRDVPDMYTLTIRLNDIHQDVETSVDTVAAAGFKVGQTVQVMYQVRSLPGLWQRVEILEVE